MITPAYSPTATERVLPRLALDFTTAVTDSRVATARAGNTATRTNSSGVIEIVNANLPRYDFSPTTLICLGQLIEGTRTNLFLNSLIDGTSLSTQTVVVTATAHTISFYGTGTITLSGAATATVTGTGVYPNRQTLTFTPLAGALICTVTGSVQYAQLEVGSFVTSFIPTAATSVTRNADIVTLTGTNFSSWYNASEGAFTFEYNQPFNLAGNTAMLAFTDGTNSNVTMLLTETTPRARLFIDSGGSNVANIAAGNMTLNAVNRQTSSYKVNNFRMAVNGATPQQDTSGAVPVGVNQLQIGSRPTGLQWTGYARKLFYYPQILLDAELQAFSK